ncbi:MAG: hypothetical protein K0M73_12555, partial [Hydrogenophaga sp.]|nr:hypothetical protein [Hydrogenophaga sp.]
MNTRTATASSPPVPAAAFLRLLAYSSIGLVMFFLPLEIAGKTTILFDHAATYLAQQHSSLSIALVLALMAWGAAAPLAPGRGGPPPPPPRGGGGEGSGGGGGG